MSRAALAQITVPYIPGCSLGTGFSTAAGTYGPTAEIFPNLANTKDNKDVDVNNEVKVRMNFYLVRTDSKALDVLGVGGELGLKVRVGATDVNVNASGRYTDSSIDRKTSLEIIGRMTLETKRERAVTQNLTFNKSVINADYAGSHFVSEVLYGGGAIVSLLWTNLTADNDTKLGVDASLDIDAKGANTKVEVKGQVDKVNQRKTDETKLTVTTAFWGSANVLYLEDDVKELNEWNADSMYAVLEKEPEQIVEQMNQMAARVRQSAAQGVPVSCQLTPLTAIPTFTAALSGNTLNQAKIDDVLSVGQLYDSLSRNERMIDELDQVLASIQDKIPEKVGFLKELDRQYNATITARQTVQAYVLGEPSDDFDLSTLQSEKNKADRALGKLIRDIAKLYDPASYKGPEDPVLKQPTRLAPFGTILPYFGAVTAIPAGWRLCNGENGTPNLSGRFVRAVAEPAAKAGEQQPDFSTLNAPATKHSHKHNLTPDVRVAKAYDHSHTLPLGFVQGPAAFGSAFGRTTAETKDKPKVESLSAAPAGGHTHAATATPAQLPATSLADADTDFMPKYYASAFIIRYQ